MKRQRIGLACEKCRKLKAKCDGQQPECGRCKGYGFICTWPERQRSSTKAGDTVGNAGGLYRNSKSPVQTDTQLTYAYIIKSYEALIQSVRLKLNNTDQTALNLTLASIHQQLPEDAANQIGNQITEQPAMQEDSGSSTYVGKASDIHFFKTIQNCMREQETADTIGDNEGSQYYDQTEIPSRTTAFGQPLLLPSQEEGIRYLDIYFSTIHVAYPFLNKSAVLDHFKRMCDGNIEEAHDRPFLALLSKAAKNKKKKSDKQTKSRNLLTQLDLIFSIGSYYMSFPHKENTSSHYFRYFEQGLYLSNELTAKGNLTNIWICLVQCFFLLAVCQTDSCWNILGFAIRMAQSMGLHVDNPPPQKALGGSDATEWELRRRTWYSLYVLDRLLALQLGRPMAIHEADFHVTLPSRSETISFHSTDGAREGNLADSRTSMMDYFLNVIKFSDIVGLVIRELYRPTQVETSPDRMLSGASTIDTYLFKWRVGLPRHLRFDLAHTFERSVVFKRQRNMLAVKYHHLRALVFRPFLCLPVLQRDSEPFMALFRQENARIQEAERICISEAQQTAHLLHNVDDEQSLVQDFPWWQMISCLICASSILYVAELFTVNRAEDSEASQLLREDAETCLKVFQALSVKSAAAKKAVDMLQGLAHLSSVSKAYPNEMKPLNFANRPAQPLIPSLDNASGTSVPMEGGGQWPSEISNTMEWSVQFLDIPFDGLVSNSENYAMGAGADSEMQSTDRYRTSD